MGGLGNVLFQINYGRYLRSQGYNIVFVDSLLKKSVITFILGWKIHSPDYLFIKEKYVSFGFVFSLMIIFLSRFNFLNSYSYFSDKNFNKDFIPKHLFCYFQSEQNFFESGINFDDNEFFNTNIKHACVLHRRYTDSGWIQPTLNRINALKLIPDVACTDSRKSFSEDCKDINWTIKTSTRSSFEDFQLMVSSNILICSNSTFCIWAALLGNHNTVFIPKEALIHFVFLDKLDKNFIIF